MPTSWPIRDCSRPQSKSSGNSTLVLHSTGGPTFDASDGNFLRDRGNALASSPPDSRLSCGHIVRGASDTVLLLVRVPVPLATLHIPCRVPHWNALSTRFLAHRMGDYGLQSGPRC